MSMTRIAILLCFIVGSLKAQENEEPDTTVLHEFLVSAYQYNRPVNDIPAAVNVMLDKDLLRFNNSSLVAGLNTIPGVRMEERSPGSYRLSMRGSSLRSPFGIRNVKLYWNDLPFTDAGGNTYLNLFDFSAFQQIEIAKGPASSLYGAGTGGAVLLRNDWAKENLVDFSTVVGSYGLLRYTLGSQLHSDRSSIRATYAHQQSDGYREQTQMFRDVVQLHGDFDVQGQGHLSTSLLYSDLSYQTPGGLTLQQFNENPRQARPAAGPNPGAVEQKATVFNKTFYSGVSYDYEWTTRWSNKTGVYGTFTQFDNPTIRNYERRTELGFGGRTNFQYKLSKARLNFGGEFQHGFSPVRVYANNQGTSGTLQTDDEITLATYFVFAQGEFFLPADWFLTVGASLNKFNVDFTRLSSTPPDADDRSFVPVVSPRIALLKKITPTLSTYASYSSGYSPPTVQELYPSAGFFDQQLLPEIGHNLEAGIKGSARSETISFNAVVYNFQLDETIVVRHTDDGGEYFVNAGKTAQQGAELQLAWQPKISMDPRSQFKVWTSYTFNHYRFKDYQKDTINYDGNKLTGVPSDVLVTGIDVALPLGLYLNSTFTYTGKIPLNDANSVFADTYTLLGARVGYKKNFTQFRIDLFVGVDNALDEDYSLGHDLNAVGGRYYNAAPDRNYYGGISGTWLFHK